MKGHSVTIGNYFRLIFQNSHPVHVVLLSLFFVGSAASEPDFSEDMMFELAVELGDLDCLGVSERCERLQSSISKSGEKILVSQAVGRDRSATLFDISDRQNAQIVRQFSLPRLTGNYSGSIVDIDSDLFLSHERERNGVSVRQLSSGRELSFVEGRYLYVSAIDPSGSLWASGGWQADVWSVENGQRIMSTTRHEWEVMSVGFTQDGTLLATGTDGAKVKLWDLKTGALIHTLNGHYTRVDELIFSSDNSQLLTRSANDGVNMWDVATGKLIARAVPKSTIPIAYTAVLAKFTDAGPRAVITIRDRNQNEFLVFDAATGELVSSFLVPGSIPTGNEFDQTGQFLIVSEYSSGADCQIWDTVGGNKMNLPGEIQENCAHLSFLPDGQHIFSISDKGRMTVWRTLF